MYALNNKNKKLFLCLFAVNNELLVLLGFLIVHECFELYLNVSNCTRMLRIVHECFELYTKKHIHTL